MTNEISTHTPINLEEVAVMAKMPANQTYLSLPDDPDCDKDDAKIEVRREGPSVLVYVSEDGGYADVDAGELPELIKALSQAGTDARVFLSAIRKYSLMKRKKLDCQLIGHQTKVEYEFGPYTVAFEVWTCALYTRRNGTHLSVYKKCDKGVVCLNGRLFMCVKACYADIRIVCNP